MANKILETDRLLFYQLNEESASLVLDYYKRNRHHFQIGMPLISETFLSLEHQQKILRNQKEEIKSGRLFKIWLFEKGKENNLIGDISFNNIVGGAFCSSHLGYKIDKNFTRKKLMTEGLNTAMKYAFKILKLHRIEANIMPVNLPSIKLAESLGFVREGFSKSYLKINGKWEDHIRYALLNPY